MHSQADIRMHGSHNEAHRGHSYIVNRLYFVLVLASQCLLISILPKNQAAPIEIVISDFFRILKTFIAFDSLCHESPKAKGKL